MKSSILRLFSIAVSTTLLSLLVGIQPAYAAGIVVNTNADTFDVGNGKDCSTVLIGDLPGGGDGEISLREAICAANNTAGADTITFDADYTITLGGQLPSVTTTMTITGNGAGNTIVQANGSSGMATYRVFFVDSPGDLSLNDLTVRNGGCDGSCATFFEHGGGIFNNYGTVTVTNSAFSGNGATYGGGIYNEYGTVTVTGSTFSGNSATDVGGGIYNSLGTGTVTNSTFSGNSAGDYGGGIYTNTTDGACGGSPAITIANSTFSDNSAGSDGGGINNNNGVMTLLFNTITASPSGGGVFSYNDDSTCTLADSNIIAGNTGYDVSAENTVQRFHSLGHNLIGVAGSLVDFTQEFNQTGDQSDVADPKLGSLADNGGPTQTVALLAGSPAINAGDATACAASPINSLDQRGVTRPQDAICDIGAYEYGASLTVTSTLPAANASLASLSTITVTFSEDALHDASSKAANNTANYLLVEQGTNGGFDTQSCEGGVQSDDTAETISNASYDSGTFTATLTLASPLTNGQYRLFVCGTTSIWSTAGRELNDGANDTTVDFTVASVTAIPALNTGGLALLALLLAAAGLELGRRQ